MRNTRIIVLNIISYILIFISAGCNHFPTEKLPEINYGMELEKINNILGDNYYLYQLKSISSDEFRHIIFPIDHKYYSELHFLIKNNLLYSSYLMNHKQVDEWQKLVSGNKINFIDLSKNWKKRNSKYDFNKLIFIPFWPFMQLAQIGTISLEQINQLKIGMTKNKCIEILGEPHFKERNNLDFETLTYDNQRFIGTIVYCLFFKKTKLICVKRGIYKCLSANQY